MRMVPNMLLLKTRMITPALYCTAVASSCPFIKYSPSPAKVTTVRCGSMILAAIPAGTPYPIAPLVGASCVRMLP